MTIPKLTSVQYPTEGRAMPAEFWRMGATPVPVTEIGRMARDMQDDGWDGLAVGEAHGLLPDPYVALAMAAGATTTLKVGTAVAVPLRHPLLAAGAMATLQARLRRPRALLSRAGRRLGQGAAAKADAGSGVRRLPAAPPGVLAPRG